jgi:hypothetical protein
MSGLIFGLGLLFCSVVWLVLLVATGFNSGAVGVGLLAVLSISGAAGGHRTA